LSLFCFSDGFVIQKYLGVPKGLTRISEWQKQPGIFAEKTVKEKRNKVILLSKLMKIYVCLFQKPITISCHEFSVVFAWKSGDLASQTIKNTPFLTKE